MTSHALRITWLRQLPKDTFEKIGLVDALADTPEDAPALIGHFCRDRHLLFDLQSLIEACHSNLHSLTGEYHRNSVLIPELLLHQIDTEKKKFKGITNAVSEVDINALRVRSLVDFLLKYRGKEWLIFQQKGVHEDESVLTELNLHEKLDDERRFISFASYIRKNNGETRQRPVVIVTSSDRLASAARHYGFDVVPLDKLDAPQCLNGTSASN
ncbi:PIN domain [Trypanosoma vivax]|uniref:PIN domain-containing protein n=1 Tax=Trypanosoma vivax (strain Y486) TaxID=1055687 RepID=G0UAM8_TRYVY|nr:hypothetical protein TRVL_03219 [Trypanosoma vivax]KAH8611405.1 PIN domain [Trypanosoma vivax]CCC52863.1 conserved hypothetical protein [Trypanosoma vivax Y486]